MSGMIARFNQQVDGYQKVSVKGVKVNDFIDFDPKISSIIDIAAKSKLFSVIVDDLNTAKEVL